MQPTLNLIDLTSGLSANRMSQWRIRCSDGDMEIRGYRHKKRDARSDKALTQASYVWYPTSSLPRPLQTGFAVLFRGPLKRYKKIQKTLFNNQAGSRGDTLRRMRELEPEELSGGLNSGSSRRSLQSGMGGGGGGPISEHGQVCWGFQATRETQAWMG